uniref:Uncharacterized protein n=1 Tax=Chlamydomonas euryale TaxID=1486919 RepID=A0A7R9YW80_9CHLO|mmetsp:Transcript_30455/g.90298  ORF Transcript_30455/g.90298 Transcript_30455/m.90298 type:complete len:620 (+) Transcript_30455:270-2129(+)
MSGGKRRGGDSGNSGDRARRRCPVAVLGRGLAARTMPTRPQASEESSSSSSSSGGGGSDSGSVDNSSSSRHVGSGDGRCARKWHVRPRGGRGNGHRSERLLLTVQQATMATALAAAASCCGAMGQDSGNAPTSLPPPLPPPPGVDENNDGAIAAAAIIGYVVVGIFAALSLYMVVTGVMVAIQWPHPRFFCYNMPYSDTPRNNTCCSVYRMNFSLVILWVIFFVVSAIGRSVIRLSVCLAFVVVHVVVIALLRYRFNTALDRLPTDLPAPAPMVPTANPVVMDPMSWWHVQPSASRPTPGMPVYNIPMTTAVVGGLTEADLCFCPSCKGGIVPKSAVAAAGGECGGGGDDDADGSPPRLTAPLLRAASQRADALDDEFEALVKDDKHGNVFFKASSLQEVVTAGGADGVAAAAGMGADTAGGGAGASSTPPLLGRSSLSGPALQRPPSFARLSIPAGFGAGDGGELAGGPAPPMLHRVPSFARSAATAPAGGGGGDPVGLKRSESENMSAFLAKLPDAHVDDARAALEAAAAAEAGGDPAGSGSDYGGDGSSSDEGGGAAAATRGALPYSSFKNVTVIQGAASGDSGGPSPYIRSASSRGGGAAPDPFGGGSGGGGGKA